MAVFRSRAYELSCDLRKKAAFVAGEALHLTAGGNWSKDWAPRDEDEVRDIARGADDVKLAAGALETELANKPLTKFEIFLSETDILLQLVGVPGWDVVHARALDAAQQVKQMAADWSADVDVEADLYFDPAAGPDAPSKDLFDALYRGVTDFAGSITSKAWGEELDKLGYDVVLGSVIKKKL